MRGRRVGGVVRGRRVGGGVGVVAHCTFSAASTFSGGRVSVVSNSSSSYLSRAVSMVDGGGGVMLT